VNFAIRGAAVISQLRPQPSVTPALSADGMWAAFQSSSANLYPANHNLFYDIFLTNFAVRPTHAVTRVSLGRSLTAIRFYRIFRPMERFCLIHPIASNLVEGIPTSAAMFFLFDRQTGLTRLISSGPDGQPARGFGYGITGDGNRILYFVIIWACSSRLISRTYKPGARFPVSPMHWVQRQ